MKRWPFNAEHERLDRIEQRLEELKKSCVKINHALQTSQGSKEELILGCGSIREALLEGSNAQSPCSKATEGTVRSGIPR